MIRPANRPLGTALRIGILVSLAAAGGAVAGDVAIEAIGTVKGDTVFVTLDKVTEAALAHNEMLAASGAQASAARADAFGAWSALLPRLSAGEYILQSDDPLTVFGYKLSRRIVTAADFDPMLLNDPLRQKVSVTRLAVQQPIFNGGMGIYGKLAADAAAAAAEYDHVRAGETVRFQAVQAYHALELAQTYTGVIRHAVESAEGHVRQARAMVDAEMATMADLLQARVHLSGLEQRLIEMRNLVAVAGEHIKLLTAVRTELPLAVAPATTTPVAPAPARLALEEVVERSDLLAHEKRALAASRMVGVARGAMLPHVNLSLERSYYGEDPFDDDATGWSVGIYATLDLGIDSVGQLRRARAEKRAAAHMYEFELRRAQVEATEAWLAVKAAAEKVAVAEDAVEAARESLRIVTNQYREGLASMVDLLDTQAAATRAEGDLVQALHDHHVGLARLRFSGVAEPASQE
jgi:outer membrane protein